MAPLMILLTAAAIFTLFYFIWRLTKSIDALHQALQQKHHTYNDIAGIEDATAVIMECVIDHKMRESRLEQALKILREMRVSPHAYDPDRPAGRRPEP